MCVCDIEYELQLLSSIKAGWPVKVECEVKLDRNEMSMLRWMRGFDLKDAEKYGV